jgi:Icc-related predicted phosphoesterase
LHGSNLGFRKFLNAANAYKVKSLILGGDITGKFLVPIVEETAGTYVAQFLGQKTILSGKKDLESLEKRIADSGSYSFRATSEEITEINADPANVSKLFRKLIAERLREWLRLCEEVKATSDVEIYATGGNDDEYFVDEILRESKSIINPVNEPVQLNGLHEMISCPYGNMTPWKCPRDISEDELHAKIEEVAGKVKDFQNAVFNFHVPPINSRLDLCPKLDVSTNPPKPIVERGETIMYGAGSSAVRAAIEKYQPLLALHGHIHESRGITKIGRTLCCNPGSEYSEGIVRGVIVNLGDKKVQGYQLTSG